MPFERNLFYRESFMSKYLFFFFFCIFITMRLGASGYEILMDPRSGKAVNYAGSLARYPNVSVPSAYQYPRNHLRGVWVATVENIDFPQMSSPEAFKKQYIQVVNNLRSIGCNAIFFQIRPANDAFYKSALNPTSVYLTGKQGRGLGGSFDPLPFMIQEAHRRGLQFHAWLNPYRVSVAVPWNKSQFLRTLSPDNFAARNPDLLLCVPTASGKNLMILDPGHPRTVRFLLETVDEIIRKYPVDGIHMDDYFYPYEGLGNLDAKTFRNYNTHKLSLDDWRRRNVDLLVYNLSSKIRDFNRRSGRTIQFGISPFGIWANKTSSPSGSLTKGSESYKLQHADTRKWVKMNWIDYIVPQLYWTFGHDKAAYAALADWWAQTAKGTRTRLYIGHSPARLGTNAEWSGRQEIFNQFRYNSKRPEIQGSILFSYRSLFSPGNAVMKAGTDRIKQTWRESAYSRPERR